MSMSIVEAPPNLGKVLAGAGNFLDLLNKSYAPEFQELVRRVNEEYLHWHEFRYKSVPQGLSPEIAWALLRFGRSAHQKPAAFKDKYGKPFSYWIPDFLL